MRFPNTRQRASDFISKRGCILVIFLQLYSNDLKNSCRMADESNAKSLVEIVGFLYKYAPGDCWGSPEKVKSWCENAGRNGPGS